MKLTIALIVAIVILIIILNSSKRKSLDRIFSLDPLQLFIIDVRTTEEYDAGHFSTAVNIPCDEIEDRLSEIEPHKEKGIILYCHSGSGAATAEKVLRQNGFLKVINVGAYKGIQKYDA